MNIYTIIATLIYIFYNQIMEISNTLYVTNRNDWRLWLEKNFDKEKEIWFIFPMKEANEKSVLYNDAVEEALCFGWIDSTIKHIDETHRAQRFTPRKKGSKYSRPNIERLIEMHKQNKIHPLILKEIIPLIETPYIFPEDILDELKKDEEVWTNYNHFTKPYQRIRIAYIDDARKRPDEFNRRLINFIKKTKENKIIKGFGGIDKYYK